MTEAYLPFENIRPDIYGKTDVNSHFISLLKNFDRFATHDSFAQAASAKRGSNTFERTPQQIQNLEHNDEEIFTNLHQLSALQVKNRMAIAKLGSIEEGVNEVVENALRAKRQHQRVIVAQEGRIRTCEDTIGKLCAL